MKVFLIVIAVLVVIVILHKIRATKRKNAIIIYCRNNGGFENMYPEIIQGLKDDICGEIVKKNEYSVTICDEYRNHRYFFEQLYGGGLLIRYDKEAINMAPIHEKAIRKLWTFSDDTPAKNILLKIKMDLGNATLKNL